jgi:superfamily II DNA or RNA helicase
MQPPVISADFHGGTVRLFGVREGQLAEVLGQHASEELGLVFDSREPCYRCDAMHAAALRSRLHHLKDVQWSIAAGEQTLVLPDKRELKLRDDQHQAVADFESGSGLEPSPGRGLVVMPTGTGKTTVAIELMIRARTSVLVVVPVRDLMYQWHTKIFEATGVDAGLIGDGVHRVSPVSVTTYDSAAIHMGRIGDKFGMIVFDEVHHLGGTWRSDAARMSTARIRLGLTATLPSQPDRCELLFRLVGPVSYEQSIDRATGRTLARYDVRRIVVQLNGREQNYYKQCSAKVQQFVREQRERDSSFQWERTYMLAADVSNPDVAKSAADALRAFRAKRRVEEQSEGKLRVLEDLFRLHAGEPVLVFVGSNVMARRVSLRFLVPCLLSHCGKKERRELLEGFAAGRYPVLVANRVLDEGVDLPEVKTAIVLGGLSSQRQAIQRLGRVLRKGNRNQRATLYEVITEDTKEVMRSRDRRRNDAYRRQGGPDS